MISIQNITKDFGDGPVLENVSLEIKKGESVVIIGGSGCGKSTLLRCMNRLITPDKGDIYIDGENILDKKSNIDAIRRKMGMVYQQFNLFSHLSVIENVILAPMKVLGISRSEAEKEARMLLKKVGMAGRENAMPSALSGGQKQRVAIARTLAMHPEVIFFDEPTSALDPTMVDEVEAVIRDLVDEGMTSVIVTHEMRFAKNIASRVIFLAEGGIYEEGTPKQVFDNPKKVLTQRFLYRSRMYEKEIFADSLDLYSLSSELKDFLKRYEMNSRIDRSISVICDELLYPVFSAKDNPDLRAEVKLLCSESGGHHTIIVSFWGIKSDPLSEPYLDELNNRLLDRFSEFVFSNKKDDGWDVCVQI